MRKVICKNILTIIISKNESSQCYTDCVVTGCRSERSELTFGPADNLFWIFFLPFERSVWTAAVAFGASSSPPRPRNRLFLSTPAGDELDRLVAFNLGLLLTPWLLKPERSHEGWGRKDILNALWGFGANVSNEPTARVEHVKVCCLETCDSCSLDSLSQKQKHFWIILPSLVYFFYSPTRWVNKIKIQYFFSHPFFYDMCNIFVLILYINSKQSVPPICAFPFFASCCVNIYLFLFLTRV